ncbi:hypothetical protein Trydic_g346 [Trypoxylus dichotomus]
MADDLSALSSSRSGRGAATAAFFSNRPYSARPAGALLSISPPFPAVQILEKRAVPMHRNLTCSLLHYVMNAKQEYLPPIDSS